MFSTLKFPMMLGTNKGEIIEVAIISKLILNWVIIINTGIAKRKRQLNRKAKLSDLAP